MKKMLLAVALVFSANASAQSQAVAEMFMAGMDRHEMAIISSATARCSALMNLQSAVIQRDTSNEAVAERLSEIGSNMLMATALTNAMIYKQRGKDISKDEIFDQALGQQSAMLDFYSERMQANQMRTGEMWGQDQLIVADMEVCPKLYSILDSKAWINTLETGDWSHWDRLWNEK